MKTTAQILTKYLDYRKPKERRLTISLVKKAMEEYADQFRKADAIKSGYCVCENPEINTDEEDFLLCNKCGEDIKR